MGSDLINDVGGEIIVVFDEFDGVEEALIVFQESANFGLMGR